jgi:3-dehydroquinate dehydratase II
MKHILLLNGPNLNLLGRREPDQYGSNSLVEIEQQVKNLADAWGWQCQCYQSNHEGVLIDLIHQHIDNTDGLIINPGGLTHTSISLRDALSCYTQPIIEVHLSQIYKREVFRHHSYISGVASSTLCGFGAYGYTLAMLSLKNSLI